MWNLQLLTITCSPQGKKSLDEKLSFDGCQSSLPPGCVWSQNYKYQNPVFENCCLFDRL